MFTLLNTKCKFHFKFQGVPQALKIGEQIVRAETIFALKTIESNFSFASNDGNNLMFPEMFPDSEIAKRFSMHRSKCTYVIDYGISPYIKNSIVEDSRSSTFVFSFDETTTSQVKKQCDAYITYFSRKFSRIVTRFIGSTFSGHCTANNLFEEFNTFCANMSLNKVYLLQLGMDGPITNISFHEKLDTELKQCYNGKKLVNIGSCNVHKVNNAFLKAMSEIEFDYDGFAHDISFFFKISAARREDYKLSTLETDIEAKDMMKHSKIRWLSIGKVAERIIEQWPNLKEYFNKFLPSLKTQFKKLQTNKRYKSIVEILSDDLSTIYLNFIVFLSSSLEGFVKMFQTSDPTCYLIYPAIGDLLFKIMSNFVSPSELTVNKTRKTTSEIGRIDIEKVKFLNIDDTYGIWY